MNSLVELTQLQIKNPLNQYIADEFIRYYNWIYSNYTKSNKSSKENYYKLLVIKKVIGHIYKFSDKITNGKQLEHIKGIGAKTIGRIDEIINTGQLAEISEGENQIKAVKELSEIYGIGPTKASEFYFKHKIESIKDLINAHKNKKIILTNQMLLGIKYKNKLVEKIPRILILCFSIYLRKQLYELDKDFIHCICGSFRREKDFSSDIDILITHKKLNSKKNTGNYLKLVVECLSKNFIIDSLTTDSNSHYQGFASFKKIPNLPTEYDTKIFNVNKNVVRLDIIIVPYQFYYSALLHFTGPSNFNQKLRLHAKSLGYKLSEYGLSKINLNNSNDLNGEEKYIKVSSEKDIFDLLLLDYIPPNLR